MKKLLLLLAFTILCSFIYFPSSSKAEDLTHSVGLHNRLLDFSDIQVINNDTKVPLEEISKYLYLEPLSAEGKTIIKKYGKVFTYYSSSKRTYLDGNHIKWSPIAEVNGRLYISVKFIAKELGFEIKYFAKYKTQRIYRNNYPHMTHQDFEKIIQSKQKENTPKISKATVYLTFDDGPNTYTSKNLDILKRYKVKATFFFLGNNMKNNEKVIQETVNNGHYIGTHSMTHDKEKVYKNTETFMKEINDGANLIKDMTGTNSKLIRVPYGSMPHLTNSMKNELKRAGYKLWDWDVDSNDWRYKDKEANQIFKNVQEGIIKAFQSGDKDIIVLLHDRSQTNLALPSIIEWIQKEGFTLKEYNPKEHIIQNFSKDKSL